MAVSLELINTYVIFASIFRNLTVVFRHIPFDKYLRTRNWLIYLIFFLTSLKKHFNMVT